MKFLNLISLIAFSPLAFASSITATTNLSVNINLDLKQATQHSTISNNWQTNVADHSWNVVETDAAANQLVLLSKIENADDKSVLIKFLLLDASKQPSVISAPQINLAYGQQGQINIDSADKKLSLIVTAKTS